MAAAKSDFVIYRNKEQERTLVSEGELIEVLNRITLDLVQVRFLEGDAKGIIATIDSKLINFD